MPIIKSAKKRVRVTRKASVQNAKTKRAMRSSIKKFQAAIAAKKDTTALQSEAYSAIDTAEKKGVISKNKAARKKQQLNQASKQAGTTKVGKKTTKPAAKKPAPTKKSTTAKKPAAKKKTTTTTAKKKTTAKPKK